MMTPRELADDSFKSTELAYAAKLEICIRNKSIAPSPDNPEHARWQAEGPRAIADLDSVRHATVKAFMDGE